MKNNECNEDELLKDLDFNSETNTFGSEDDARTYDFRVEKMLEERRMQDPDYRLKKVLAETIIDLVRFNEETKGGDSLL